MKKQITLLMAVATTALGYSQDFGIKLSGYVKGEMQLDSRQVSSGRDGNYLTVPLPYDDDNGKDLNNNPYLKGYGLESRLRADVSGPEFFGMQSTAAIEGDFFGVNEENVNGFHLRHAYVQLSNDKVDILVGQYWHPMFVTNVSPGVYGFNAGHPYQAFNRSPQIRVSTKGENIRFIGALLTELDFPTGDINGKNVVGLSGVPTGHIQLQFGQDDKFIFGVGGNAKTVRPGLREKSLTSLAGLAYAKANLGKITWKVEGTYGSGMTEQLMFGGYAYDKDGDLIANQTLAFWTEFSGDFTESFEWGLFAGYTQDMGFSEKNVSVVNSTYGLAAAVKDSWRLAPRFGWKSGNTKLGLEFDYTSATYGNLNGAKGEIEKWNKNATVGNFRTLVSLTQTF